MVDGFDNTFIIENKIFCFHFAGVSKPLLVPVHIGMYHVGHAAFFPGHAAKLLQGIIHRMKMWICYSNSPMVELLNYSMLPESKDRTVEYYINRPASES